MDNGKLMSDWDLAIIRKRADEGPHEGWSRADEVIPDVRALLDHIDALNARASAPDPMLVEARDRLNEWLACGLDENERRVFPLLQEQSRSWLTRYNTRSSTQEAQPAERRLSGSEVRALLGYPAVGRLSFGIPVGAPDGNDTALHVYYEPSSATKRTPTEVVGWLSAEGHQDLSSTPTSETGTGTAGGEGGNG